MLNPKPSLPADIGMLFHSPYFSAVQVHHTEHALIIEELNVSATVASGRAKRPAWGRLANLAGARRIWAACAQGEAWLFGIVYACTCND